MARNGARRAKMPNGAGSVFQRGNGRWVGSYSVPDPATGKLLRKVLYGANEAEVRAKLIDALAQRNAGKLVVRKGRMPTVAEYLDQWLAGKEPYVRPAVLKRYRELMSKVTARLGGLRLDRLEAGHVTTLLSDLHKNGLAALTCGHVRAVLRAALNDARPAPYKLSDNAAADAKAPRIDDAADLPVLEPDHVKTLMAEAPKYRDGNLWLVALATGMRQGELLGLEWSAIDFEARTVKVVRTLSRVDGEHYVQPPKSRRSRRTLPLAQVAIEALRQQRQQQATEQLKAGRNWFGDGQGDLVFRGPLGEPEVGVDVTHRWQYSLGKMGVPVIRFHDLRASCATFLALAGLPVATAQAILGHSASSLTLDVYTRVRPDLAREAADAMDVVMGG